MDSTGSSLPLTGTRGPKYPALQLSVRGLRADEEEQR